LQNEKKTEKKRRKKNKNESLKSLTCKKIYDILKANLVIPLPCVCLAGGLS